MNQYKLLSKQGEGTFSEVLKAQSLRSTNFVAIKCMKQHFDSIEQIQKLREIQALKKVSPHPHIVQLIEVLYDEPTGTLALVFELMEQNLYEAIRGRRTYLNQQKVKYYMYQLLKAIDHMHKRGIFHRDIKPENILISGDHVKLADFGSCKGIHSEHPYTEYISTRWYRAPECLLTDGYYHREMDLWGVGCVMFEILALFPLFPGNNELDQVHKIHNILGTPDTEVMQKFEQRASHMEFNFQPKRGTGIETLIPHVSSEAVDLIYKLLIYDPEKRITADQALQHPYFRDLYELEHSGPLKYSPQQTGKYNTTIQDSDMVGSSTTKLETQKKIQADNVFHPVLSFKKANKNKKKKNNYPHQYHPNYQSQYHSWKIDLHIDGQFKDSEEEGGQGFLPPIKNQPFLQMETKVNMFNPQSSTKYQNNPFKQTYHVTSKKKKDHHHTHHHSQINGEYLVLGKKASYI